MGGQGCGAPPVCLSLSLRPSINQINRPTSPNPKQTKTTHPRTDHRQRGEASFTPLQPVCEELVGGFAYRIILSALEKMRQEVCYVLNLYVHVLTPLPSFPST